MIANVLKRMSGEEMLLLRILKGQAVRPEIETELDRRAHLGSTLRRKAEAYWAGRHPAMRHSARLAA